MNMRIVDEMSGMEAHKKAGEKDLVVRLGVDASADAMWAIWFLMYALCLVLVYVHWTFVLLFLTVPLALRALRFLRFDNINIQQGLSQSSVRVIFQDSRGFMWFATGDGLDRYDGNAFVVFKHNPDDPGSLSHPYVWAIQKDPAGFLWLGTRGGGLDRFGSALRLKRTPGARHAIRGTRTRRWSEAKRQS